MVLIVKNLIWIKYIKNLKKFFIVFAHEVCGVS